MSSQVAEPGTVLRDNEKVQLSGADRASIRATRIRVIGNPRNVTRIYVSMHGNHVNDRSQGQAALKIRGEVQRTTAAGEGAIIAYPISKGGMWPGFWLTKDQNGVQRTGNGDAFFEMLKDLQRLGGNRPDVQFELFAHSGGGQVLRELMRHINEAFDTDPSVRAFVANNLRAIHDGEAIGYSRRLHTNLYIKTLKRFPHVRASFIAAPDNGLMDYIHQDSHVPIAAAFGGRVERNQPLSLDGGRLRWIPVADHDAAWWAGQYEAFFGP